MRKYIKNWIESLKLKDLPDEFETKQLLNHYQIPSPEGIRIDPTGKIDTISFAPPYVVKVCKATILHKTDENGVFLNVDKKALPGIVRQLRQKFEDAPVLIEQQIGFEAFEFIIGAVIDPTFGPAVMVGSGGILTELLQDVSFRLAPCQLADALQMIEELKVSPVLKGFRGLDLNRFQLAEIITKISSLAMDLGDRFYQLDINPIVFTQNRWMALDAKLMLCPT